MPASTTKTNAPGSADISWRILALVNLFRLLVAIVLGGLFWFMRPSPIGQLHPALFLSGVCAYFFFAVASIPSLKNRWPRLELQTLVHISWDVLAIMLLTYASGGMGSGLAALLVLPVGVGSLIVSQRLSLLLAAVAAIGLLVEQILSVLSGHGDQGDLASAGIMGALIFAIALATAPLARRLRESEAIIRQRDVDLANLAELNEFIVQHLRESIMVVDENDRIRLINESAAQLLHGGPIGHDTLLGEISPRLLYLLGSWRLSTSDWGATTLSLVSADGGALIHPHFVALHSSNPGPTLGPTLIFLEDTTVVAERIQQTKLAALGRLSASIAHEIRNPVGAMSHAAQLLREAPSLTAQERRLTEIIESNGERVSTIIENVLQLSRRDSTQQERLSLNEWTADFHSEFEQTFQVEGNRVRLELADQDIEVRVDPSHLHQITWNLCENAFKYGVKTGDKVVELRTARITTSNRPFLEVADRGPGIALEDAERIFEPFFTSGGGTGLGLFIARELAHCNGAVLLYEPRTGGGSVFRIVFADPQRWEG
jgi:two-component system sensor histidine kinase PilS (NtrC family)